VKFSVSMKVKLP